MASLTLRDLPDEVLSRIRILSKRERRSLNKEFIVIVEEGLDAHLSGGRHPVSDQSVSPETQVTLWNDLAGRWQDTRSTSEIVEDIRQSRTVGREVNL